MPSFCQFCVLGVCAVWGMQARGGHQAYSIILFCVPSGPDLSLNPGERLVASKSQPPFISAPTVLARVWPLPVYVGARDLNSGPGACAAELSHLPRPSCQVLDVYSTGYVEVCWI